MDFYIDNNYSFNLLRQRFRLLFAFKAKSVKDADDIIINLNEALHNYGAALTAPSKVIQLLKPADISLFEEKQSAYKPNSNITVTEYLNGKYGKRSKYQLPAEGFRQNNNLPLPENELYINIEVMRKLSS
ncbi:MAG: hypothetical protein V4543_15605 [Bacteroidota bacterium]